MATSKHLDYSSVKPLGVPSKIKIAKFLPQSAYGNIQASDTIRFQINSPGFWDPYSAYFNIEVEADLVVVSGFEQIDHSAHSLISELIIYSRGTEIERIQEYDVIAAILGDIAYSSEQRASREHEGYGSKRVSDSEWHADNKSVNPYFTGGALQGIVYGNAGANPLTFRQNNGESLTVFFDDVGGTQSVDYAKAMGNTSNKEKIKGAKASMTAVWNDTRQGIFGMNRADENLLDFEFQSIAPPGNQHSGYGTKVANNAFCGGCNEPRFYNGAKTLSQASGRPRVVPVLKKQFSIPILSGLLGVLMPRESYKYLPMAAFEDLVIEIRLNKYALFSSGYSDDVYSTSSNFNTANPFMKTPVNQITRGFKITTFELMADIIQFDNEIEQAVLAQVDSPDGIILHSTSWYLGPQFLTPSTQAVTGTWQINLGFESLKSLIFCFLLEDYKYYNFCRKQFRVSRNLTWMQVKIGIDYYPSLPIEGHAGNVNNQDNKGDNSEFLINTYKAFNKLHDAMSDNFLNQQNFSINNRSYDVTDTNPYYNTTTDTIQNASTAVGLPGFYENNYVGKAVYGLSLEGLKEDYTSMSGINTLKNKPFEITLRSDPTNVEADRAAVMNVFCYYDFLVQIKREGIRVLGRG